MDAIELESCKEMQTDVKLVSLMSDDDKNLRGSL